MGEDATGAMQQERSPVATRRAAGHYPLSDAWDFPLDRETGQLFEEPEHPIVEASQQIPFLQHAVKLLPKDIEVSA